MIDFKQVAAVVTSFMRSVVLAVCVLIINRGWGISDLQTNWMVIGDAALAAGVLTIYLWLDKGFTQYGLGSEPHVPELGDIDYGEDDMVDIEARIKPY